MRDLEENIGGQELFRNVNKEKNKIGLYLQELNFK